MRTVVLLLVVGLLLIGLPIVFACEPLCVTPELLAAAIAEADSGESLPTAFPRTAPARAPPFVFEA